MLANADAQTKQNKALTAAVKNNKNNNHTPSLTLNSKSTLDKDARSYDWNSQYWNNKGFPDKKTL